MDIGGDDDAILREWSGARSGLRPASLPLQPVDVAESQLNFPSLMEQVCIWATPDKFRWLVILALVADPRAFPSVEAEAPPQTQIQPGQDEEQIEADGVTQAFR